MSKIPTRGERYSQLGFYYGLLARLGFEGDGHPTGRVIFPKSKPKMLRFDKDGNYAVIDIDGRVVALPAHVTYSQYVSTTVAYVRTFAASSAYSRKVWNLDITFKQRDGSDLWLIDDEIWLHDRSYAGRPYFKGVLADYPAEARSLLDVGNSSFERERRRKGYGLGETAADFGCWGETVRRIRQLFPGA